MGIVKWQGGGDWTKKSGNEDTILGASTGSGKKGDSAEKVFSRKSEKNTSHKRLRSLHLTFIGFNKKLPSIYDSAK